MDSVYFKPWLGQNYAKGINGKMVLVLGESHYCANAEDAIPNLTTSIISDLLDPNSEHEAYKNTYTKFERAMMGKELDFYEKTAFWNSIIFYNYIQEAISGPRIPPNESQKKEAESAFFEVLNKYKPDIVIVWGMRLYDMLPATNGSQASNITIDCGDTAETWQYNVGGKNVRVLPIYHPSTGFSWDYWHKFIDKVLR